LLGEKTLNGVLLLLVVTSTLRALLTEWFAPGMIEEDPGA
jgi:hypothetical protein